MLTNRKESESRLSRKLISEFKHGISLIRGLNLLALCFAFGINLYGCTLLKQPENLPQESTVQVKSGDSLYRIAQRYGWNFEELARQNKIEPPYTIFPGQMLRYVDSEEAGQVDKGGNASLISHNVPIKKDPKSPPRRKNIWQWPVTGKVVQTFNPNSPPEKIGIYIQTKAKGIVRAVAAGKVVYAGDGAPGSGYLVIVEHEQGYQSSYGNNKRLYVREGKKVKAGQKLAVVATNADKKPVLLFGLYKGGKAIDPLPYLPRK